MDRSLDEPAWVQIDQSRPLLVGVIPHTQCNPRLEGCGFCTFAHDRYHSSTLRSTVDAVIAQIHSFFALNGAFEGRPVDSLYFGGATANLAPRKSLRELGLALTQHLDLTGAELTLEGVPRYFLSLFGGPFEAFAMLPARHHRISMGVQTFDAHRLDSMGRSGFGNTRDVQRVIDKAHRHSMTVSGDFLFNLPGQTQDEILADAKQAAACGFDQICAYHLVLVAGQRTPWADNRAICNAVPTLSQAVDNWLALRMTLLERGYMQTTLTNFERAEVQASTQRFVYEDHSYMPEAYDALGFGPLSISTFVDTTQRRAVKYVRGKLLREGDFGCSDYYFAYDEQDLRLLFVTRSLARLAISRTTYRTLFGTDLTTDFATAIEALQEAALIEVDHDALHVTPKGMFFADSIAGLLAMRRVEQLRAGGTGTHTHDLLAEPAYWDSMG